MPIVLTEEWRLPGWVELLLMESNGNWPGSGTLQMVAMIFKSIFSFLVFKSCFKWNPIHILPNLHLKLFKCDVGMGIRVPRRACEPTKTFTSKQEVALYPVQAKFSLKRPALYWASLAKKFGIYYFQNTFFPILLTIHQHLDNDIPNHIC